jgi:hypothetical protein
MSHELLLKETAAMDSLAQRLAESPVLSRFPNPKAEAESLAYSLSDLEGSMRVFIDEQLPKLADPNLKGEELEDLLLDVREEFRHILYHLHDPEFFRVVEPTHDWLQLSQPSKP